jgi:hypothetical protein
MSDVRAERDFLAAVISAALGQPIKAPPDSAGRLMYESPGGRFKVVVGPCADAEWDAGECLTVLVPEQHEAGELDGRGFWSHLLDGTPCRPLPSGST